MSEREKKPEEDSGDDNAWMATFSDLNFLMITFFVLLLSMSSMDERAYSDVFGEEVSSSEETLRPEPPMGRSPLPAILPARGSWVGYPQELPVDPVPGRYGRHATEGTGFMQKGRKALKNDPNGGEEDEALRRVLAKAGDLLKVYSVTDEEIQITIEDALFFEGEQYRPTPESREVLAAIGDLARDVGGQLLVQSNRGSWELAAKRSSAVVVALIKTGVPGEQLAADVIKGPDGYLNFAIKRAIDAKRN